MMDLLRLQGLFPQGFKHFQTLFKAKVNLCSFVLHKGIKKVSNVPREERGRECVHERPPKQTGKYFPCFIYFVLLKEHCHPCWARASNSVEMKFQPSVCLTSPAQWIHFSFCLCLIFPFVVKRCTIQRWSLSVGNPSGNFGVVSEEMNWAGLPGVET